MQSFYGVWTALITPFRDGKVDEAALARLISRQIDAGVTGIVPCGTTGESPTLSHIEHQRVIALSVELAAGKIKVMAGTGSNSTAEAIEFTRFAKQAGADATLVVAPYYNKPTPTGQIAHFTAIADAADIPNFIYNIPGRSVINISDDTLAQLAKHPNIVGVKDATGDVARVATLRQLVNEDFVLLSGEDMTMVGFNAQGGHGVISVISNLLPAETAAIQRESLSGNTREATRLHDSLVPLISALFAETNPVPVKYAAHLIGLCDVEIRLPLCAPSDACIARLKTAMQPLGLLQHTP